MAIQQYSQIANLDFIGSIGLSTIEVSYPCNNFCTKFDCKERFLVHYCRNMQSQGLITSKLIMKYWPMSYAEKFFYSCISLVRTMLLL